jgi:hypothetical protein
MSHSVLNIGLLSKIAGLEGLISGHPKFSKELIRNGMVVVPRLIPLNEEHLADQLNQHRIEVLITEPKTVATFLHEHDFESHPIPTLQWLHSTWAGVETIIHSSIIKNNQLKLTRTAGSSFFSSFFFFGGY